MSAGRHGPVPATILCADWGKKPSKRAVWIADIKERSVRQVPGSDWSFHSVLTEARQRVNHGPVVLAFDLPLGVPESYARTIGSILGLKRQTDFLRILKAVAPRPDFFEPTTEASDWQHVRPFFAVPPGDGGFNSYRDAAARHAVDLYRGIDKRTGANSLFVKSGIPGSVGSAACAFWTELAPHLSSERDFAVWPFEGNLADLLESRRMVLAEIYPRVSYAIAILDSPAGGRPRLKIAKTDGDRRREAVRDLRRTDWVARFGVKFVGLESANENEDDFDACLTAAALLRCVLDDLPLCSRDINRIEGGMLGAGAVDLGLSERSFGTARRASSDTAKPATKSSRQTFRCPIPGCEKVFTQGRLGWDAHIGSAKLHPLWHPELKASEDRKRRFKAEFPEFFF